ncbi:tetratricopeptide repeat protein [Leptolyngbyaceae cyanobacterium UHCC 1019]
MPRSRVLLFTMNESGTKEGYTTMMEFDPPQNSPEFWEGQGRAHCEGDRYAQAIAAFDQAIALNAAYCKAWNNRGNALCGQQKYAAALGSYDQAISLQPDYHQAWFNRGLLLIAMNAYGNAVESFDRAIAIYPDPRYLHAKAGIWLNKKLVTV